MEMNTVKTVAVFAIIFGCFAVLYPRIFHPMLLHAFGLAPQKQNADDLMNRVPPHLRQAGQPRHVSHSSHQAPDDFAKHMRPGPHPGLRAAAEMKKQASTQGGGRGMMGVVLPMYAVGIIIYLLYTLTKVFGKKSGPDAKEKEFLEKYGDVRYDADKKKFVFGNDRSLQEEDEAELISKQVRQKDLERLLLKADEQNLSSYEMRELRRRLMETEKQMERILKAMQTVHHKVSRDDDDDETEELLEDAFRTGLSKSVDSSPDMDTYEVVNGLNGRGTGDGAVSSEETLEQQGTEDSTDRLVEDIGPAGHDSDYEDEDIGDIGEYGDDDIEEELDVCATSVTSTDEGLGTSADSPKLRAFKPVGDANQPIEGSETGEDIEKNSSTDDQQYEDDDITVLEETEEQDDKHPDLRKRIKDTSESVGQD